ncbi:hypothetical protein CVT24_004603 [Panaeolus cyanescens]|uniref:Ion transport domain-containing protein n=1 Tax=Panaeolus cyanescens TaxID=181874 RepID=A0A409YBC5_9AGAR|nr:hypothetical protein CVT24_004603 [Panaeolus cyanescens]
MSASASIELNRVRPPPLTNTVHFFTTEDPPSPPSPSDPNAHEIFPNNAAYDVDDTVLTIYPLWKRNLYQLMEQPTSSRPAFIIHMATTFLIVASAFVTVLETVPAFHSIPTSAWFGVESFLVALFTVEYITRCVAWSNTLGSLFYWMICEPPLPLIVAIINDASAFIFFAFFNIMLHANHDYVIPTAFYGVVDLLSVLPYYIELMLQQDTSVYFRFSILRMFRLLRVFRPFRYNHTILLTIEVMFLSVRRSQHALFAIGFFVLMILTVFSTLLYFAERGTWDEVLGGFVNVDGDPTNFSSIPAAAWFVLVSTYPLFLLVPIITPSFNRLPFTVSSTSLPIQSISLTRRFTLLAITTVGYGEITPRSFLGRLITLPLLVFGLLLITLPSFVLGREFSHVWERMNRDKEKEDDSTNPNGYSRTPLSPIPLGGPYSSTYPSYPSYPPHPHGQNTPYPPAPRSARPDLSNMKLAQNQTELSRQIDRLGEVVEEQGVLIRRLVGMLERGGLGGALGEGERERERRSGEGLRERRSGEGKR